MKLLIIGDEASQKEFTEKVNTSDIHQLSYAAIEDDIDVPNLQQFEAVVDLSFSLDDMVIAVYANLKNKVIVLNAVQQDLNQYYPLIEKSSSCFIGINALPGFISLPKAEICLPKDDDAAICQLFFEKLNWEFETVACRIGMVTPRVICMIINEAYYTLQEGTASKSDIDMAMKLGTNYPFGPFEWANKIGIKNVYETLFDIYNDTGDERYKICPLLKTQYLRSENF